jgi:hypothetical protein
MLCHFLLRLNVTIRRRVGSVIVNCVTLRALCTQKKKKVEDLINLQYWEVSWYSDKVTGWTVGE